MPVGFGWRRIGKNGREVLENENAQHGEWVTPFQNTMARVTETRTSGPCIGTVNGTRTFHPVPERYINASSRLKCPYHHPRNHLISIHQHSQADPALILLFTIFQHQQVTMFSTTLLITLTLGGLKTFTTATPIAQQITPNLNVPDGYQVGFATVSPYLIPRQPPHSGLNPRFLKYRAHL